MKNYKLSDAQSLLYVLVENDASTLMSRMGHDHVIRATGWQGKFAYDRDRPESSRVEFTIPVQGLRADEADMRQRVGLSGKVSSGDCRKTEENMLKKNQLWGERYAEITFVSTGFREGDGAGKLLVSGALTIRGVSKSLEVEMTIGDEAGGVRASGRFSVRHGDFGFQPFSAPLGALKNKDNIEFVIDVLGVEEV